MNLPQQFLDNMQQLLGDKFSDYLVAMQQPPVVGVRINPLKVSAAETENICRELNLQGKIPFTSSGYYAASSKIGKHPYHMAGLVYVQEPSSMMPVSASGLKDEPNKELCVLDLCAAPGGKSGQIAEILAGCGVIVSNEIEPKRASVLASNIERMGYKNVICTCSSPSGLAEQLPTTFDYIFVDAPCGGEGMFRKNPETITEWKESRIAANSARQAEILCHADAMLKPGGKLIYSTCTFAPAEDEDVALAFAKEHNYSLIMPPKPVLDATTFFSAKECRRFYPHLALGEGQFVCVMQKPNGQIIENVVGNPKAFLPGKQELLAANNWILNNFNLNFAPNMVKIGDYLYIISKNLQNMLQKLKKVHIFSAGVAVGSPQKDRFVPHHNMFMAFGEFAKYKINYQQLNSPEVAAYLHGEQLTCNLSLPKGATHGTFCVQNHPLGGVKITGSALKNLLPKGLRI